MPRFLMLLSPSPGAGAVVGRLSPSQIQERTLRFMDWVSSGVSAGVIRSGARLAERAKVVARGDGTTTVSQRTAPSVASFFVIEAENFDSAIAIASGCPGADPGTIELCHIDLDVAVGEAQADAAVR